MGVRMAGRQESVHLLHVDDEPDFADMAATFLERTDERFDVEIATSAADGLTRLDNLDVDCVISDYDMPGENGITFLEAVRKNHPDLPFILFTGKGSEDIASEAISAGVTDYLQKETGTSQYEVLANRVRNAVDQYYAQTKLANREKRLNLFFEQSPLGVIEWDDDFNLVRHNDAAEQILGYTQSELAGRSWEVIVPESDQPPVDDVVNNLLENEGGYHSINENVRKDGARIICEWHNRVITDETGTVVAVFSQFHDISDRARRERGIEALHSTSNEILDATTADDVAEIGVDAARDILDLHASAVHLYSEDHDGLAPVAWTDRTEALVGHPPTFEPGEGIAGTAYETGQTRRYGNISDVSGRYNADTPVRSQIVIPLDDHGVLIAGSTETGAFDETDVALAKILARHLTSALDRIDREHHLRHMQQIVREMNTGAVIVVNGHIQYINPYVTKISGYEPGDIVGEPMSTFIAPEHRETVESRHQARLAGDDVDVPSRYEIAVLSEDGDRIPVVLDVSPTEYNGEPATLSLLRERDE